MGQKHFDMYPRFDELFLSSLIKNGQYFDNAYSQGPYTEAALMGLLSGQKTLDYNGYLRNFADSPNTLFDFFSKNGYRTYRTNQLPHMYESSYERNVTDMRFISTPSVENLYDYRFNYYKNKKKKNKLKESDLNEITNLLEDHFVFWKKFCRKLINNDLEMDLLIDNISLDSVEKIYLDIQKEESKFLFNKKQYVDSLLSTPKNDFSLYKINRICFSPFFNCDKEAIELLVTIKEKTNDMQKKLNKHNNHFPFALFKDAVLRIIKNPTQNTLYDLYKLLQTTKTIYSIDKNETRFGTNANKLKENPSAYSIFNNFISFAKKTNDSFFAYLHVEDLHLPSAVFTYDLFDKEMFELEMEDIQHVLEILPSSFSGDILTPISLKYIDRKIEYLFKELNKIGKLEDTIIVLTADHGHSFYNSPIRKTTFRASFNLENYRIPIIIFGSELEKLKDSKPHSSFCIPKTISSLVGFESPENFYQKSLYTDKQSITILEYAGAGCPDIDDREMFFCAFDNQYYLALKGMINKPFSFKNVYDIYEMTNDYKWKRKMSKNSKNKKLTSYLLNHLENRRLELYTSREKKKYVG